MQTGIHLIQMLGIDVDVEYRLGGVECTNQTLQVGRIVVRYNEVGMF